VKYGPVIHKEPGIPLDFHIYYEPRRSVRIAMLKTKINLRIPLIVSTSEKERYLAWGVQWVKKRIQKTNGKVLSAEKIYTDGDVLKVLDSDLKLHIKYSKSNSARVKMEEESILLSLPSDWTHEQQQDAARKLVRRLLSNVLKEPVYTRVLHLNSLHFRKNINDIKIKYNVSNWGSCSRKSNINLSLRLFFAPAKVIDYVIIHELAHLIEPNHSSRFWDLVAKADPDYKESEKWLKENSYQPFV